MPDFFGKNLPEFKVSCHIKLQEIIPVTLIYSLLQCTETIGMRIGMERESVPRSARVISILPNAAHPPFSSSEESLSSLNHTSPQATSALSVFYA